MVVNGVSVSPYSGRIPATINCIVCSTPIWLTKDKLRKHFMLDYLRSAAIAGTYRHPDIFVCTCINDSCKDRFNLAPLAYE